MNVSSHHFKHAYICPSRGKAFPEDATLTSLFMPHSHLKPSWSLKSSLNWWSLLLYLMKFISPFGFLQGSSHSATHPPAQQEYIRGLPCPRCHVGSIGFPEMGNTWVVPQRVYNFVEKYTNNKVMLLFHSRTVYRASLVAQWLRIRLPMQGTRVQALVWEDPTCRGATKPVRHNYWACALEPVSHNYWSPRA